VQRLEMRGAIPPLPRHVFMAWCLVKHRNYFTFTFTWFSLVLDCNTRFASPVINVCEHMTGNHG